jgi:hypothetical protein
VQTKAIENNKVQVSEEGNSREKHTFITGFCGQYMMVFLTQDSHFFTDEAWFHLSGVYQCSKRYVLEQY